MTKLKLGYLARLVVSIPGIKAICDGFDSGDFTIRVLDRCPLTTFLRRQLKK